MKYNKVEDKFFEGKKEVKPDSKGFMDKVCRMTIDKVKNGENLADTTEIDSEVYPPLADILLYIDSDNKLSEEYARAEDARLAILKEQVLKAKDAYIANPNQDNKDLFVGLEKVYTSLSKQQGQNESVKLVFNKILPDGFWDNEAPPPEHPRPDSFNKEL